MTRKIENTAMTEALGNYFHDVYDIASKSKRVTVNDTEAMRVVIHFPQMIIHYWNNGKSPQECFDAIMRD